MKETENEKRGRRGAVHTDIKSVRKNERSIRTLKRLLAALIVIFIGLVIYVTYPLWLPKLEGIFDKPASTITNDGELAEGNFPIEPDDTVSADIYAVKNNLLVADAHTLKFYDANGKERASYSHEFSNPSVRVSGKRALVFDSGSTDFKIYNKGGEIYSKSADSDILTGALGADGTAAIVTQSDKYAASMLIYDPDGKMIYRYNSTHRIMAVSLDEDGGGCFICTFSSENGGIYSQVRRMDFDSSEEKTVSEKLDCLAVDCIENEAGDVVVVGDCAAYVLDKNGKITASYEYSGELTDYALDRGCAAIALSDNTKNSGRLVLAQSGASGSEAFREITGVLTAQSLKIYEDRVILLTSSQACSYAFSGTLAATAELSKEYSDFVYIDSGLYLISRHGIDKIGYEM